ncbi:DNA-binding response regulator [Alteromonas sp. KC3]|uniref:response regulator n=1 Tax=unclassified Alteromonas TaxID=2614992 RepID=UPI0019226472|nr:MULTISPECIES: response regulator [unclassified Alteromonas]BCO19435.1 DNA-binding response regulator [Alteromonas sp. KC3]BCO23397.1 DNA-binding response regulator [Alteromonas sp. KC14]
MQKDTSILIVEDEPKIAQILVDFFSTEGYATKVLHDGIHVIDTVKTARPDFVILDVMLPNKDGLTLCKEIRQFSDVPILLLTAKVEEIDRLMGLGFGADDYVCKPFSAREVVLRVSTILRRTQNKDPDTDNVLRYKNVSIDLDRHQCTINDHEMVLTPVEFKLLTALVAKPERVLSRNQLMHICYEDQRIVSARTIDSHMKNLRHKVSQATDGVELIHAVYGIGYKCS